MTQIESKRSVVTQITAKHQSSSSSIVRRFYTHPDILYPILLQCDYIKLMTKEKWSRTTPDKTSQSTMFHAVCYYSPSRFCRPSLPIDTPDAITFPDHLDEQTANSTRVPSVQAVNASRTHKLPSLLAGCWLVVLWHQTRLSLHNHEVLKWTKNTKTHCGKQHLITPWLQSLTIHLV